MLIPSFLSSPQVNFPSLLPSFPSLSVYCSYWLGHMHKQTPDFCIQHTPLDVLIFFIPVQSFAGIHTSIPFQHVPEPLTPYPSSLSLSSLTTVTLHSIKDSRLTFLSSRRHANGSFLAHSFFAPSSTALHSLHILPPLSHSLFFPPYSPSWLTLDAVYYPYLAIFLLILFHALFLSPLCPNNQATQ